MNIPKGTGDYSVNLTIGQMHAFLEDDGAQFESCDEDVDAPDLHDEVLFCPNCERPNQFGELCVSCDRERGLLSNSDADFRDRD